MMTSQRHASADSNALKTQGHVWLGVEHEWTACNQHKPSAGAVSPLLPQGQPGWALLLYMHMPHGLHRMPAAMQPSSPDT